MSEGAGTITRISKYSKHHYHGVCHCQSSHTIFTIVKATFSVHKLFQKMLK